MCKVKLHKSEGLQRAGDFGGKAQYNQHKIAV